MRRFSILSFFWIFLSLSSSINAQELRANVRVSAPGIQGTNRSVFDNMQSAINDLLNDNNWTDHNYGSAERIDCTININIREVVSSDEYSGTIHIQARRPVFNSSYSSPLINYQDDNIHFTFSEFEQLRYSRSNIESNLVAILAYYAYIILGYDYDSFSNKGGTPFFRRAQEIVNMQQNSNYSGWSSHESSRNRYWLVDNLLSENHSPLRECFYKYHRQGLDIMAERAEQGRANIAEALENLEQVHRRRPNSFALSFFFNAKSDELINIFSESPESERQRVIEVLTRVDPSNSDKYNGIASD
ncbi:DUF4835 family protein [Marinilabiliaceae bacterium ANBcel2]|nr:DUF4835 family protein [Marinilabiliaceae bacterium ANBcel2]